jgi:DNA end-binding protein Ku
MTGPAPSRATTSLTLSIGLLTLPCKLYSGTDEISIKRSQFLVGTNNPVGNQPYDKETGAVVSSADIEKRYNVDGEYVPLADDEMLSVLSNEKGTCDIVGFIRTEHLGPGGVYQISKLDQIRPAKINKKPVKAVEEGFSLLMDSMRRADVFALVKFVMRTQSKYAAITHDGNFYTVQFDDEVRAPLPLPIVQLDDNKRSLGDQLIAGNIIEPIALENIDAHKIAEYAESKLAAIRSGGELPTIVAANAPDPLDDLLLMLQGSVAP